MAISSLVDLLRLRAQESPAERSYIFLAGGSESELLTFAGLNERAQAIGARLQSLGAKGERALLLYPTGTDYISAFYGCIAGGAVAVPAYPPRMNRNLKRLESILDDARPKIALTTDSVLRQLRGRFDESPSLAKLEWLVTSEVPTEEAAGWSDPGASLDSLAFLQYTSASTSAPKGVMVSHGNILHNQVLMKEAVQHGPETVVVSWLPLFHDMGLISIVLASLYNGVPCYLIAPVDFLKKPRRWLEAITRYHGTFSGAPDFGYQLCIEKIGPEEQEGLDLSSWRVAFNGSEPVRAETLRAFTKTFAPVGFKPRSMFPCYGLAEHTLFSAGRFHERAHAFSRTSLEKHKPRPASEGQRAFLVSCGTPLLDARIAIADPATGRRCAEGEVGEIWLSSPSVAQGYWGQPEESERTFRARFQDGDGPYLRTGDLGFVRNKELFVTGRIKDLIILRGRNLIPQDIEKTVEECDPAVRPAFVAAVSVEAGGSERLVVIAEVRREGRKDLDADALIGRIRSAVAEEFSVEVSAVALLRTGSLPKTSSGKTQRAVVKKELIAGELRAIAEWRDPAVFAKPTPVTRSMDGWGPERLENWLVERFAAHMKLPPQRVDRMRSVASYGLDSVVVVGLLAEIEQTLGVEIDVDHLFEGEPSIRELAQRIKSESPIKQSAPPVKTPPAKTSPVTTPTVTAPPAATPPSPPAPRAVAAVQPPASAKVTDPQKLTLRLPAEKPDEQGRTHARPTLAPVPPPKSGPRRDHPFRKCVNPEMGRLLAQMGMDKSFVRGEGSWLWDESGRRYLDFLAQYGALPFGFNPKPIWSAINEAQARGEPSFVQPSYLNAAGELAQRLVAAAPPGMSYVTFANSGAEAIEAAIKLCRSTTGRHDILAAGNGFHGKTLGALSATDKEKYQKPFGAPVPGFDYVPFGDVDALRRALSSRRYAAFLVEPLQGEGGIVEPPPGYLRLARKVCREAGTLFVADEIQTGLGRTGAMFVCCELGITPDVMTVAKALGGGLIPIGACISTAAAYNDEFALKHTSTFAGNTLACRAGLATLDLLEEGGGALISSVAENGARLKGALLALKRRYPDLIGEVRGRGYLLGLRFGLDRHSFEGSLLGYLGEQEALTALVVSHMLDVEGIRVGYTLNQGGVLRIEPPLTATWEECQFFLDGLERVLQRIERRNLAELTSQVTGFQPLAGLDPSRVEIAVHRTRTRRDPGEQTAEPRRGEGRFAFLVHPLAWKDFGNLDRSISGLSEDQLASLSTALADNFDPLVVAETRVVGENGKSAYGEFILVPRRAEELRGMPHQQAVGEVHEAAKLAGKRGAKIVGLGAYTSVVTQGGLLLKGNGLPPLTTGNSYTVVAAREMVRLAAAKRGWTLPRRTVGIVGAGGSIGNALSVLLAHDAGRLVLLGNPEHPAESRERLLQVAGRMVWSLDHLVKSPVVESSSVASWIAELGFKMPAKPDRTSLVRLGEELIRRTGAVEISMDTASLLPDVDIVICCTSTTERLIRDDYLRQDAVVCDVSRPSNLAPGLRERRPDVMVLDGGVVRIPGGASLGFNASLGQGNAYACMAETMMLAMEQRYEDTSLGFDLPLERVLEMERLAGDLGFRVLLDREEANDTKETNEEVSEAPNEHFARVVDFGSARA